MAYVTKSIGRPAGGAGNPTPKNPNVLLFDMEDVETYPTRTVGVTTASAGFKLKEGKKMFGLYLTPGSIELIQEPEGDADARNDKNKDDYDNYQRCLGLLLSRHLLHRLRRRRHDRLVSIGRRRRHLDSRSARIIKKGCAAVIAEDRIALGFHAAIGTKHMYSIPSPGYMRQEFGKPLCLLSRSAISIQVLLHVNPA